jgi:hypothetical protein
MEFVNAKRVIEWRGIRRFCMFKACSAQTHSGENAPLKILLNIGGEFHFLATLIHSPVTFNLRPQIYSYVQ